ncbi:MAG: hypothetical protein Q4G03_05015 [Planctomycetia bacterium]|nr:hypothetical protein [Planctomycetia bacterium]
MTPNILPMLLLVFGAFAFFMLALGLPLFLSGRALKRRCACAESQKVLKTLEEREHAQLMAMRYSPETVDIANLPMASPELAEFAKRVDNASPHSGADK